MPNCPALLSQASAPLRPPRAYPLALWSSLVVALLLSANALAQDGPRLYDVEVLVFRHLGPATLSPEAIEDFTALPIPLLHPSEDPELAQKPSPGMETAWRKLSNSAAMEPLWYQRWRQATSNYNRPRRYRVHSDDVLERPQFEELPPGELLSPTPAPPEVPEVIPQEAPQPLTPVELKAAYQVAFPPTEKDPQNYRLDGWVSFSRQRFYHIGMDLEWRSLDPWGDSGDTLRSDDRINQNRRIEIGRFEYFDTPGLSALVRVTEVIKPDFRGIELEQSTPLDPDAAFDPGVDYSPASDDEEEQEGTRTETSEDGVD